MKNFALISWFFLDILSSKWWLYHPPFCYLFIPWLHFYALFLSLENVIYIISLLFVSSIYNVLSTHLKIVHSTQASKRTLLSFRIWGSSKSKVDRLSVRRWLVWFPLGVLLDQSRFPLRYRFGYSCFWWAYTQLLGQYVVRRGVNFLIQNPYIPSWLGVF